MRRLQSLIFLLATILVPWPVSAAPRFIDLDQPGALQFVRQQRPADYEAVIGILRDAERLPESQIEALVRTVYHAKSVQLGLLLLVSYPPKRRLTFSLGEASYSATVTVTMAPKLTPAK